MAVALRPRLSQSSMLSRYGSQVLALGLGPVGAACGLSAGGPPESVVT